MIFKKHNKFKPYLSIEKADDHTVNPKRGWYSIYPFTLPERPDFEELQWCLKKQESLCLVRVCIGNYAARSFDTPALTVFEEILSFFARHDKDMILRIIYDDEGKGMEHEPAGLSQIQSHMDQLGSIIYKYAAHIYTTQGLFIGSWGEMHTSKFCDRQSLCRLIDSFYHATKGAVAMAVRTPAQLRSLETGLSEYTDTGARGRILSLTGLYNDAITGSETDYGTYAAGDTISGNIPSDNVSWGNVNSGDGKWSRSAELSFQQERCMQVYNGGEVIMPNPYNDGDIAIETLTKMHVSYLNSQYDGTVLQKWKEQKTDRTESVFEQIDRRLGYCLVLSAVKAADKNCSKFIITIKNTGFAALYEPVILTLSAVCCTTDNINNAPCLPSENIVLGRREIAKLPAGEQCIVSVDCPLIALSSGQYKLTVSMALKRSQKKVFFDNCDTVGILTVI